MTSEERERLRARATEAVALDSGGRVGVLPGDLVDLLDADEARERAEAELVALRADLRAEDKESEHLGAGPYRRMAGRYLDEIDRLRAELARAHELEEATLAYEDARGDTEGHGGSPMEALEEWLSRAVAASRAARAKRGGTDE